MDLADFVLHNFAYPLLSCLALLTQLPSAVSGAVEIMDPAGFILHNTALLGLTDPTPHSCCAAVVIMDLAGFILAGTNCLCLSVRHPL